MNELEFLLAFCKEYDYTLRSIEQRDGTKCAAIIIRNTADSIFVFAHALTAFAIAHGEDTLFHRLRGTMVTAMATQIVTYKWPHVEYNGDDHE